MLGPSSNIHNIHNIHDNHEHMDNLWVRRTGCPYTLSKTLEQVLKTYNIKHGTNFEWNLYLPCSYNDVETEINAIPLNDTSHNPHDQITTNNVPVGIHNGSSNMAHIVSDNSVNNRVSNLAQAAGSKKNIFIINNCDSITSKSTLWMLISNKYNRTNAKQLMPDTYVLYEQSDLQLFKQNYNPRNLYILKKNMQRQKDIMITSDIDVILNGNNNEYVVVQELLQNPYLVNGRKINLRVYMLVVCVDSRVSVYVHNEGFMYYTPKLFKKNSRVLEENITTGYVDRMIYKQNPLTHGDFRAFLDNDYRVKTPIEESISGSARNQLLSTHVFNNIYQTITDTMIASVGHICKSSVLSNHLSFQLFGVDIAVDDKLNANVMEINKGPDIDAKDERDRQIKIKVLTDVLKTINIIPTPGGPNTNSNIDNNLDNDKNGFIQLM